MINRILKEAGKRINTDNLTQLLFTFKNSNLQEKFLSLQINFYISIILFANQF